MINDVMLLLLSLEYYLNTFTNKLLSINVYREKQKLCTQLTFNSRALYIILEIG